MKSLLNALQEGRLIELPDADKEKSLRYLAHLIEAVPDLAGTPDLAEAVFARENAQCTALGHGVACPHMRTSPRPSSPARTPSARRSATA
jgi:mannitol/fructose-specific phosphotransferase system IIA component